MSVSFVTCGFVGLNLIHSCCLSVLECSHVKIHCHFKVNVRTGREGYFKRTRATDRSTEMGVEVFNTDESMGIGDSDLHQQLFAHAAKAIAPTTVAMDAVDLPYFRLGNSVSAVQPRMIHSVETSSSASRVFPSSLALPAPVPLGDAPPMSATGGLAPPCPDDQISDSDSDDGQRTTPGFSTLHDALAIAGPKAKAKPAPKQSAKAKAVPKAKSTTMAKSAAGRKRKTTDGNQEPLIMTLPDQKRGKTESIEGDQQLVNENTSKLSKLKETTLGNIPESATDACVSESLKTSAKDLGNYGKQLKAKIKSLKRRKDSMALTDSLQDLVDQSDQVQEICNTLLSGSATVDTIDLLQSLSGSWPVSAAVYKRGFKSICLTCLKFGDWACMSSMGTRMTSLLGEANGMAFFQLMISETIQRLLKSLPVKATCLYHIVSQGPVNCGDWNL